MITKEKIKIFDRYAGDYVCFARSGNDQEKKVLSDSEWSLIDNFYHDIEFINKKLTAQTYTEQTIVKLKENCDGESLELFTDRIKCYHDFQEVAEILKRIKAFISKETDTVWAGFENANKFLEELNQDIEKIENCDYQTLEKVYVEFLPTCSYQEISMSNGWSDKYLELSSDFDKIYERMKERKTAPNSTFPKAERKWWQKLFSSE